MNNIRVGDNNQTIFDLFSQHSKEGISEILVFIVLFQDSSSYQFVVQAFLTGFYSSSILKSHSVPICEPCSISISLQNVGL